MTGEQMCKAISRWQREEYGVKVHPEKIWNASSTGELWHVFELYQLAEAAGYGVTPEAGAHD